VEAVRLSDCGHQQDAPTRDLNLANVSVMLRCADCGQPRIVLAGELAEVITELMDLYAAEDDASFTTSHPETAEDGGDGPADAFGQWLARQAPGTIQPPPRAAREVRMPREAPQRQG
jgi:hypothetical protein